MYEVVPKSFRNVAINEIAGCVDFIHRRPLQSSPLGIANTDPSSSSTKVMEAVSNSTRFSFLERGKSRKGPSRASTLDEERRPYCFSPKTVVCGFALSWRSTQSFLR